MSGKKQVRDDAYVKQAVARGAQVKKSSQRAGQEPKHIGGALRRMVSAATSLSPEFESKLSDTRYVPIGYARYVQPTARQRDYIPWRLAGWRVMIPRAIPPLRQRQILHGIYFYGPQSVGFVRMGDTLVPAVLNPGDRVTIGQSAINAEAYPLSL